MPIYDYSCGACGHVVEVVHHVEGEQDHVVALEARGFDFSGFDADGDGPNAPELYAGGAFQHAGSPAFVDNLKSL